MIVFMLPNLVLGNSRIALREHSQLSSQQQ